MLFHHAKVQLKILIIAFFQNQFTSPDKSILDDNDEDDDSSSSSTTGDENDEQQ